METHNGIVTGGAALIGEIMERSDVIRLIGLIVWTLLLAIGAGLLVFGGMI